MPQLHLRDGDSDEQRRRWRVLVITAAVGLEVAATWLRTGRLGGNIAVRCRKGHVFTTIWIPAASLKSARLGWWRFQYCPVGRHWSIVTPLRKSEMTDDEQRSASENTDIRIP